MDIAGWDDADTDWWVQLRLGWQPTFSQSQLRALAGGQIARFSHRAVAWDGPRRVGYAHIAHPPGQQMATAQVLVADPDRGRGVGSALFADLLAQARGAPLTTAMPDQDEPSLAVARHWGFVTVSHAIRSRLDLHAHPPVPTGPAGPAGPPGCLVRIVDGTSPVDLRGRLDALLRASDTSPEAVELGWNSNLADYEQMFPGVVWAAVEQRGHLVAVASASPHDRQDWLVIYTGVLAAHRRQGLGRLAKTAMHAAAAERGARTLTTDNDARNTAVRALNASLGYQRVGGEVRLQRAGADTSGTADT